MRVVELLRQKKSCFSFEFFPPKTEEGFSQLYATIDQLKELKPAFVSVTYGAMGTTRQKTIALVKRIKHEIGLESMAHLTCVGHTRKEIGDILEELDRAGIENVLALRGDPPQGEQTFVPLADGFRYAAELVQFIRERFSFSLGVAGYPEGHLESPSLEEDLLYLKEKVDSGANFIITQLFFDNRFYFDFVKRVRSVGIQVPVLPGIMPIVNFLQIKRFTEMCGATLPEALLSKLKDAEGDKKKVVAIGIHQAIEQCSELLKGGAPGIHFYTLNRSDSPFQVYQALQQKGLTSS